MGVVLAAANLCMGIHLTYTEFHRESPIILHDVRVLQKLGDNNFRMDVRNPRQAERVQFYASFCPDSDLTPEIDAGVILQLLQYREDTRSRCMEVSRPDEGYVLLRSHDGKPLLTEFVQQR